MRRKSDTLLPATTAALALLLALASCAQSEAEQRQDPNKRLADFTLRLPCAKTSGFYGRRA